MVRQHKQTSEWPRGAKIETMALVLEARHGELASDVAAFFSLFHEQKGNFDRQAAWADVSLHIQKRQSQRNNAVAGISNRHVCQGLGLH